MKVGHITGSSNNTTLLTITTATQNGDALSYRKVRGLYFLAVVFVRRIINIEFAECERSSIVPTQVDKTAR